MSSLEELSPVTPDTTYNAQILEALDILDDFIAKGNVSEAASGGEARQETQEENPEDKKEENQEETQEEK